MAVPQTQFIQIILCHRAAGLAPVRTSSPLSNSAGHLSLECLLRRRASDRVLDHSTHGKYHSVAYHIEYSQEFYSHVKIF